MDLIKDNPTQAFSYTSYKKVPKKFYTPSPNLIKSEKLSDRFIPLNKGTNLMEKFNLTTQFQDLNENNNYNELNKDEIDNNDIYNEMLKTNFLNEYNSTSLINKLKTNSNKELSCPFNKSKLFSWKKDKNKKNENFLNNMFTAQKENENILNNNNLDININQRKISIKPYKELPAPNLIDDFYLNLLDWSQKNQIAVGCASSVVLWNNNKTQSETLFVYDNNDENNLQNNENKYVSSLIWSEDGEQLAVGNSYGHVEIYDVNKKELISTFKGHSSRVGVVSWNRNLISSGSKDYSIITRDTRCRDSNENIIKKFLGHQQEVCGLKWSFDGSQLASGGNDNNLMVWSLHFNKPLMHNNDHIAAVKAIAWSPHQHNILASGGGTADRTIRFWNTTNFEPIFKVDTGSQVCNLVFSKSSNELVSTHGYSLNQINVWKLPNMQKIKTLTGHSFRVLYLSLSPDGQSIVTGAGDKTLKFWNIFPPFKNNYNSRLFPSNKDFR
jgi:cell division cycle 20-like protein 1 (cofactor of APC complex)